MDLKIFHSDAIAIGEYKFKKHIDKRSRKKENPLRKADEGYQYLIITILRKISR